MTFLSFCSGILTDVKDYFQIKDAKGGLLQTAFVLSYMLFAPLFGYLGDRYNRKIIMAFGVFLWSLTTMAGSFMKVSMLVLIRENCVLLEKAMMCAALY